MPQDHGMAKVPGIDWNDPAHIVIPDEDSVPMDPQFMAAMDEDLEVMKILRDVPSIKWNTDGMLLNIAIVNDKHEFLKILFTLPNVEYDVNKLPKCQYHCKHCRCKNTWISRKKLKRCFELCRKEHKRNGKNYSDVVNFLKDALKISG